MKTFKKLALVTAIAAAPFAAQAELVSMNEALMGDTTGQAGITVEIDLGAAGIKVGSVVYTDTQVGADTDGGSVALENIAIGLTGTLVQTIDVDAKGDLKMTVSSPGTLTMSMGEAGLVPGTAGQFSALKLVGTDGSESELINNLDLEVVLGTSTTTIMNLGTQTASTASAALGDVGFGLGTLSRAGVTGSHATDVSSMAIKMSTSLEVKDMNLGMFGYTDTQATVLASGATAKAKAGYEAGYITAGNVNPATATAYAAAYGAASGDTNGDGVLSTDEVTAQEAIVQNALASGSAVQVTGVKVTGSGGGSFAIDQTIWAVGGNAKLPGSTAGVYIQMGAMDLDVAVAGIAIGGSSIGSLAITGLELGGMTQRIYGH